MVGAKWRYAGLGIVPASTDKDVSTGDPHCVCLTSHLPVDPYGRAFVTASEDRLYVSDSLNRRGTVIRRTFDA